MPKKPLAPGELSKKPSAAGQSVGLANTIPPMPTSLSPAARKVWPQLTSMLSHLRVLTLADSVGLEALAECYADLLASRKALAARGSSTYLAAAQWKNYPEVAHIADVDRRLRGWLAAFGATPGDRAKVSTALSETAEDDDDAIYLQ